MHPEEITRLILAMISIDLFFQVYPNNLLNVLPASLAFLASLFSLGLCSINVDLVLRSSIVDPLLLVSSWDMELLMSWTYNFSY